MTSENLQKTMNKTIVKSINDVVNTYISELSLYLSVNIKGSKKETIENLLKDFICKKDEKKSVKTEEIYLVMGYSEKVNVLVGNTISIKDILKEINGVTYNNKLSVGAGWIVKKDKQEKVNEILKEKGIKFKTITLEAYNKMNSSTEKSDSEESSKSEEEPKVTKKKETEKSKSSKKEEVSEDEKPKTKTIKKGTSSREVSEDEDEKPKPKAKVTKKGSTSREVSEDEDEKPKPKSKKSEEPKKSILKTEKDSVETIQNDWKNQEDPDNGIIFLTLPLGVGGRNIKMAVGTQDSEAPENKKGLDSVVALTEEEKTICKKNKWSFFDVNSLPTLKKKGNEHYEKLCAIYTPDIVTDDEE